MKSIDELSEREPRLEYLGLTNLKKVHWNYCTPILYEQAVKNNEGVITHL
jgi:ATP-dependent phosphoenolpyruvate carboxykinase